MKKTEVIQTKHRNLLEYYIVSDIFKEPLHVSSLEWGLGILVILKKHIPVY